MMQMNLNASLMGGAIAAYMLEHRRGEVQREATAAMAEGKMTTVKQLRRRRNGSDLHRYLERVGSGCGGCALCVAIENKEAREGGEKCL